MLLVRLRLPCILFHRNVAPEAVGVLRQAGRGGVLPLSHTQGLLAAQRDGWCGMLRDGPLRQGGARLPAKHTAPTSTPAPLAQLSHPFISCCWDSPWDPTRLPGTAPQGRACARGEHPPAPTADTSHRTLPGS